MTAQNAQDALYAHPETGEALESLDDFRAALRDLDARMAPLYRVRRALRDEMAVRFEPPEMPRRTGRTEKQELIVRCPRCNAKIPQPGEERTELYQCPVCGRQWQQREQWDEDAQEWKFSDEPYGFCRTCTPEDDL